jgi:hypothetical protein
MDLSRSAVGRVCRGERKTAYGYSFGYTNNPVTEMRICECGNRYTPKNKYDYYCADCGKNGSSLGPKKITDRPFTLATNLMIVYDAVRGKPVSRTADATNRSVEAVEAQRELLMNTGTYKKYLSVLEA